jgi:hypothetical protein
MSPGHRHAAPGSDAEDDADQAFRSHDRIERRHSLCGTGTKEESTPIGSVGLVQNLGGDVAGIQPMAEFEQLPEAFVLRP